MKAVIICDDFAFAAKAASALARVASHARVHMEWTIKCWPLNALNVLPLADKALIETIDAQLILFPDHLAQSLPLWVFDWLRRWAARRVVQDAALGVIKDGTGGQFPDLANFAREQGLSLIVGEGTPRRSPMKVFDSFRHEQHTALPLARTYLTSLAVRPSYRSFGINE
jgi:hypothetical protein